MAIIGAGSWGTGITALVAPHADEVCLWAREERIARSITEEHRNPVYLKDATLASNVIATTSMAAAVDGADAVILASPSAYLRATVRDLAPHVASDVPVLVLTKGIETPSHRLMHEIVADEVGNPRRIAVLAGPNHAEEIVRGAVSAAVIASENPDVALVFQNLLASNVFRAYTSDDIVGVEVCSAVKNVIAIACGIAAGRGAGDNTLAALMTRGIAEIGRMVSVLGGNPLTAMGLAGMGDLVVTCTSHHSRNRTFGEALVAGETLEQYQERTHMVVEGARACVSVCELADERGIEAPISHVVNDVLYHGLSIDGAIDRLLGRVPNEEFYGYSRNGAAS